LDLQLQEARSKSKDAALFHARQLEEKEAMLSRLRADLQTVVQQHHDSVRLTHRLELQNSQQASALGEMKNQRDCLMKSLSKKSGGGGDEQAASKAAAAAATSHPSPSQSIEKGASHVITMPATDSAVLAEEAWRNSPKTPPPSKDPFDDDFPDWDPLGTAVSNFFGSIFGIFYESEDDFRRREGIAQHSVIEV
jgi:hypothetical protein